jgi:flagellar basal-body rod protein FlgB
MLESIALFSLTDARLRYLAERQNVIAANIANADTPNYQAKDLPPFEPQSPLLAAGQTSAGMAPPLALVRTSSADLQSPDVTTGDLAPESVVARAYDEKPDGNSVSLEEQMEKAANTTDAFSLASAAYAKSLSIMKIAIDSGK